MSTKRKALKKRHQRLSVDEISERAMLAQLHIEAWHGSVTDKKVSSEVAAQHQTGCRAGNYVKRLFPQGAKVYDRISQVSTRMRQFHRQNTLPWKSDGSRLLTSMNYMPYMEGMRELKSEREAAVQDFVAQFPSLREGARKYLKSMYDEKDYPKPATLEARFTSRVIVFPLPKAQDFHAALPEEEQGKVREQIDKEVRLALKEATEDLWQRLFDATRRLQERLGEDKDKIKPGALLSGVVELCDLLPRLNVSGDERLEEMARQLKRSVQGHDAKAVCGDKALRKKIVQDAQALEQKMAGLM